MSRLGLLFILYVNLGYTETRINKLLNWSKAALIVGNTLDAQSSFNKYELNPLLADNAGKFRYKGIAIKAGVVVGILLTERYICKREEKAKTPFIILNFAGGAVTTGFAVRNWRN